MNKVNVLLLSSQRKNFSHSKIFQFILSSLKIYQTLYCESEHQSELFTPSVRSLQ